MEEGGRNHNHGYKKGLWTAEEDRILTEYIKVHGKGKWNQVTKLTGLKRCGKSCRLRWMNYLNPTVKRGDFSEEENDLIVRLHNLLGNSWSLIAGRVPGRTDNQVKNHWNSHLSKKLGVETKAKKTRRSSKSKTNTTSSDQLQAISQKENSKSSVEPLLAKEDSFNGGYVDEGALALQDDHEGSRDCGMWETMMMGTTSNNEYDHHDQGSLWFYNDNEDDLSLDKPHNYVIDSGLDYHNDLHGYSFDSLDDIAF